MQVSIFVCVLRRVSMWLICSAVWLMTPGVSEHWRSALSGYSELTQCERAVVDTKPRVISKILGHSLTCTSASALQEYFHSLREGECSFYTRTHIQSRGKDTCCLLALFPPLAGNRSLKRPERLSERPENTVISTLVFYIAMPQTYKVWSFIFSNICKLHK